MKKTRVWNKGLKGEEYRQHYKNGYPSGMKGKKHSEETKIKIGEKSKGRKWSLERRNKIVSKLKGIKHSQEHKEKISHSMQGKFLDDNHPRWKGGLRSYYQNQARKIMEQQLNRELNHKETIHHLDFDWKNNNLNNLHLFKNRSEHLEYHWFLRKRVEEILNV